MQVLNLSNQAILATEVKVARTFGSRLIGLMFSREFPMGSALFITPCRSIHTFFMNYSIDVVYLDTQRRIVGLEEKLKPRKIGVLFPGTCSVLEFPAGMIESTDTEIGHQLEIQI